MRNSLHAPTGKRPRRANRPSGALLEPLEPRTLMSAAPGDDMVLHWNDVAMNVMRADTTLPGPGWASRSLAITSLAIFDAVNSLDRTHDPYEILVKGYQRRDTSIEAAVASAAHDVMAALYPAQQAMLDAELSASLMSVPDGPKETRGVALGKITAAALLAARADDGAYDVTPYEVDPAPGHWSPDPYNPGQIAWGPGWGLVEPFALQSGDQFQSPPPPDMTSAEYAASYNEVKSLGARDSTTRTADQSEIAVFWAYDAGGMGTPPGMFDQQVAIIARQKHNSLAENARLFALVNMAQADAGIAAWETKFAFDLWRPVTAIHRGDEDGNPATIADPEWEPMGAPGLGAASDFTPPFPAYVSGHATFGAAVYSVLANFYGTDRMKFTLHSDELPGVTREFTRFSQASAENARSRIYMGVHWNFDDQFGQIMGRQIASYVFRHELEPTRHGRGGGSPAHCFTIAWSRHDHSPGLLGNLQEAIF